MTATSREAAGHPTATFPGGRLAAKEGDELSSTSHGKLVPRGALVRRLMAARGAALALIVAPVGYGKSALLAQWAERDDRPFAWVAVQDADNEPLHLMRALVAALSKAGVLAGSLLAGIDDCGGDRIREARALLREAIEQTGRPFVLVLENAQALRSRAALDIVAMVVEHLAATAQVALASRTVPALPIGRLRAQRKLVEFRAADLVMTRREAASLATLAGLQLDPDGLDTLVRCTEGWPAGLYLATLRAREQADPAAAIASFTGDDRIVAEYLREELLAGLAPDQLAFLSRVSILDRLSGPLCDFVLEREGSARMLTALARENLLLVPLDRTDSEYRYHRLLAQMLRRELRHDKPELGRVLHSRASEWHARHGDPDRAIEHAVSAEDAATAGTLMWRYAAEYIGYGRNAKLRGWLERLREEQIASYSTLALTAAASELFSGALTSAERWLFAARRRLDRTDLLDREHVETGVCVLSAAVATNELQGKDGQAALAYESTPADDPWRPLACLVEGISLHLSGRREPARARLEEGVRRGAVNSPAVQVLCLAQLVLLAIDREDWDAAELLAARARGQVERTELGDYVSSALVFAASADVQARKGRVEASQHDSREACRLLSAFTELTPWYETECSIALARAALRQGDVGAARRLIGVASRQLELLPQAAVAARWVQDCSAQAELAGATQASSGWCLTTAELRLLQFLPTHLSYPEIADRLYVSANTVKTHTRAVYRKLDASSRAEAVARARAAGLLDSVANEASQV